jgi:hypothetical protein
MGLYNDYVARNTRYKRMQPDFSPYVQASMNQVGGKFDETSGHYATLVYVDSENELPLADAKKALYRAAGYFKVSMFISNIEQYTEGDQRKYRITFQAVNKAHGRAAVVAKYGNDRTKWSYSPIKGDLNYVE